MLSWADLKAIKQNSGHHPVEKKDEVNHHYHQMVYPVVDDTPTETLAFGKKDVHTQSGSHNSGCRQIK